MSLAIQNLFLGYKNNDNDNDDDNDSTCVLSKILIVRILTQVKLCSLFRGLPIDYFLMSWVINYAHNCAFLACLLYREALP